jgi:surface protein
VGVALLLFLPAHVAAQTAITDANIGAAATAWLTNPTTATTTYGPIADWNTAAVTSMASLFSYKSTFNSDISKWNVASVSNMDRVRLASVCAASSFSHVLSLTA